MILCVGLAADDTFVHTLLALKRAGVAFDALDLAQLTRSGRVEIPLKDLLSATFTLYGVPYVLGSYRSAWIRLLDISTGTRSLRLEHRAFGLYQALARLFNAAPLPIVNPPLRDGSNFAKLFHAVELASVGGWRIPRSCLTSDVLQARDFITSCVGDVIFKGASGVKTWATQYEPSLHEGRLPLIETCPVLFQERIDGPDVRVHVIGDRTFAEIIESPELDYRTVRCNSYRPIALPQHIAVGCCALTRACSIPFLGVDFKLQRSSGDWFFLEANSLPCYQGYDRRTGGAISRAIVDWLSTPARAARQ
jgi:glutathione synthase/RimK-type ligase-like ATP-grasp enzyme